jgi:hypothetical protein
MTKLNDLLMASLRQLILGHLPYDRQDADVVRGLEAMTTSDLLIRWLNWTRRMLPSVSRQVLQSREFLANPVQKQRNDDVRALIEDIQQGADLTKYLSRSVQHGYINPANLETHRRKDLDLMLSAWGIHHLHFSQVVEPDGFVKRGGPIIFAMFRSDKAFLIDIMTHNDWARKHVIRVIVDNWPNEGLVYEVKGIQGLSAAIDDDERLKLRKVQGNTMLEIDGKVYWPAGGMTDSGVGVDTVRQADEVINCLQNFASQYEGLSGILCARP